MSSGFPKMISLILLLLVVTACATGASGTGSELPAELPAGNSARGAQLFNESINGAPACSGCHTVDGAMLTGPTLQEYAATALTFAQEQGQSIEAYTYTSIVQPGTYLVSGFSNIMYAQYGRQLSAQQIADLIAYLLTL